MGNPVSKIASYLPMLSPAQYSIDKVASSAINYLLDSWFSRIDYRNQSSMKDMPNIPSNLDTHIRKTWMGCDMSKCVTLNESYPAWAIARNAWAFTKLFEGEPAQYKSIDFLSIYEWGQYLKDDYQWSFKSSVFTVAPNTEASLPVKGNYFVECPASGAHLFVSIDFCYSGPGCGITVMAAPENMKEAESFLSAMVNSLVVNDIYYLQCLSFNCGAFAFCDVIPTSWDNIILKSDVKDHIRANSVSVLEKMDELMQLNMCPSRNSLLISPPGMAKTTIFRATSCELSGRATSIWCTGRSVLYPEHVTSLFEAARSLAPCIIFIEDMDLFGKDRSSSLNSSDNRVLNEFLACLDGTTENRGIVVMASTNDIVSMDEAVIRPGRFDVKVEIPLPDAEDRAIMLRSFLENYKVFPDSTVTNETWKNVIDATDNLTGAYIKDLAKATVLNAVANGRVVNGPDGSKCNICADDLMSAVGQVMSNFAIGNRAHRHHEYQVEGNLKASGN